METKPVKNAGGLVDNLIIIDETLLWEIPKEYQKKNRFSTLDIT